MKKSGLSSLSFLNVDEALAIIVIVGSFFMVGYPIADWLREITVIYLLICVAMRKYENILRRQK